MFRNIRTIFHVKSTQSYNQFIYRLQNLPFIGKWIPNSFYNSQYATIVFILGTIIYVLKQIASKAIYFGFLLLLSSFFQDSQQENVPLKEIFLYFLFAFSFVAGFFSRVVSFYATDKEDQLFILLLHMNPKKYFLSKIHLSNLQMLFFYAPILCVVFFFLNIYPLAAVTFTLLLMDMRYIVQFFYIYFYNLSSKRNLAYNILSTLFILAGLGIAIAFRYIFPIFSGNWMTQLWLAFIGLFCIVLGEFFLRRSNKYFDLARLLVNYSEVEEMNTRMNQANLAQVTLDEKDLEKGKSSIGSIDYQSYTGMAYVNKIFFDRMHHVFRKKRKIRWIVSFVILGLSLLVPLVLRFLNMLPPVSQVDAFFQKNLPILILYLSMFIYLGEEFTRLCFYHMDRYLMKLNFYREPKNVITAMFIRIKMGFRMNFPQLLNVFLATHLAYFLLGGRNLQITLITGVFMLISMLYNSLYYLYMYYLFQPYTENMEKKSIVVNISDAIIGIIPFFLFQYQGNISTSFVYMIFAFMALVILVGAILLPKLAPRHFKLRT